MAVNNQGIATDEINASVQRSAVATKEVSDAIVCVTEGADATSGSARDLLAASRTVSHETQDLKNRIESFLSPRGGRLTGGEPFTNAIEAGRMLPARLAHFSNTTVPLRTDEINRMTLRLDGEALQRHGRIEAALVARRRLCGHEKQGNSQRTGEVNEVRAACHRDLLMNDGTSMRGARQNQV